MSRITKSNKGIPAKYPLCLHANCPKADTCLHQLAFRRHEELGSHLTLINPSLCTMQDNCPHYACAQPVRFARGFTNFQKRMFPQQYSKFMDMLILHFGRNQYFMLLLSAKNRNVRNNVSAVPINRYCGFIFQKVSPPI